ncbi:MAG TPA: glycosyltransferase family 4 protein [Bryobacteraceae bacterium]|nr:glycosyltransferase family 4 protein [Bryobacteraceae bacterium]
MNIAQVAPLYESVPPKLYGGTERVVSYLTEALVEQGHNVVLFASGDSVTSAELVAACPQSLRLDATCPDPTAYHVIMLDQVFRRAHEFDVIHFHMDFLHFPLSARDSLAHLTTLHGRLDLSHLFAVFRQFPAMPVVSISNAQRAPLPLANWQATVYHGLPIGLHTATETPGSYLAFLGRISPEKRLDLAIEIAKRTGYRLLIAAKVDAADREYFTQQIRPLLDHPLIEYIGEINESEKTQFLGGARALLFPIDWPEPFGLAMIESMACGTPVIAFPRGSVPEVIDDGVSGYIVNSVDEAVSRVADVEGLSRRRCREAFEKRFSATRMADDYIDVYHRLCARDQQDAEIHEYAA